MLAVPLGRVRGDLLVGEAPRERADLALVVGQLVEAHRRSAGRRAGGLRAAPARRAALRPAVPTSAARRIAAAAFNRRPRVSKRMTAQPSSRATRVSTASGLTATGWPTARSIGRSDSESEYAHERGEVDALGLGDLPQRLRLALAVGERAAGAPGVDAVDDLRARADAAVEAEDVREQGRHLLRRRRDDVDAAAGVLVLVRDGEHLRVQARQDAREDPRREALQVAHAAPGDHRPDALAHLVGARVGRALEPEAQVDERVRGEPPAADQPGAPRLAGPVEPGRARHQRAVEVEEGRLGRGGPSVTAVGRHQERGARLASLLRRR